ncbi:hypothetical protein PYCC9005_004207 [Savitreella phatthalungensis]
MRISRRGLCNCAKLPVWPSFSQPIDYDGYMTKIRPYRRHVLIETPERGAHDWQANAQLELNTISCFLRTMKTENKLLFNRVSNTISRSSPRDVPHGKVLIFPDGIEIEVEQPDARLAEALAAEDIRLEATRLGLKFRQLSRGRVLACAHMRRDERCGKAGVVLAEHINARALPLELLYVDHMGGHKYAGNLIFHLPPDSGGKSWRSVWYGRVNLDNLDEVLAKTLDGGVVDELVRLRA